MEETQYPSVKDKADLLKHMELIERDELNYRREMPEFRVRHNLAPYMPVSRSLKATYGGCKTIQSASSDVGSKLQNTSRLQSFEQFVTRTRRYLFVRPEDGVLILRPNKAHHLKVGGFYRLKI
jgi:hypothetical protein